MKRSFTVSYQTASLSGAALERGLEQGAGLRKVAVIVEGHRVHQLVFDVLREGEGTQQDEQAGQQNPSSHVR